MANNPEKFCFLVRESARYLTKTYGLGVGLPAPDSYGLDNYVSDRAYQDHLSGDLITQLNYLRQYTSLSRGKASAETRSNLIGYLHNYAKGIYRELGGKARPSDKKISVPSAMPVEAHFSNLKDDQTIDKIVNEILYDIIPGGVAAERTHGENRKNEQSCIKEIRDQIGDVRTLIDALTKAFADSAGTTDERMQKALDALRKEFDQKFQKMEQDTANQNSAQARSIRQFKELLDQLLAAQNRQQLSQDDIVARLSALEEKLDQIEKMNDALVNGMQDYSKEIAQYLASFYQDNRPSLEQSGDSVKELGVRLLKAGKSCLQVAVVFAEKAGAAAERITKETRQQADQLVSEAKKRAAQSGGDAIPQATDHGTGRRRPVPQGMSGTSYTGTGLLQYLRDLLKGWNLGRWCKTLSVAEPLPLHRTWNAFCITGLILYFLLFYVLVSEHSLAFPVVVARVAGCLWYALSFFLFYAGRLTLYFTQIRIVAGVLDRFLRGAPILHLPFWKKAARGIILAVILYLLTRYCYDHFYMIARNGFGWKQIFLAARSDEIRQMVRWCLSVWGAR